jgi:hypothetical protein
MDFSMHRFLLWAALVTAVLFSVSVCFPKCFYIPGDASTIQGGIDQCEDGDTVLVSPGLYTENISIDDRIISIISSDGPSATKIQPVDPNYPIILVFGLKNGQHPGRDVFGGEISGFTITGGEDCPTIHIFRPGRLIIKDNIIHDNIPEKIDDQAVILCQGDSTAPVITRNIFYGNYGVACIQVLAGGPTIVNNTFDGNRSAIISSSATVEAVNNIVVNSTGTAIDGAFLGLDYNDVWNNNIDYG